MNERGPGVTESKCACVAADAYSCWGHRYGFRSSGELPRLAVDQLKECIETIRVLSQERDRLRGALKLILDGAQTQGAEMSDGRAITGMTWVDVAEIARAAIDGKITPVSES